MNDMVKRWIFLVSFFSFSFCYIEVRLYYYTNDYSITI